jgi:hypothetical protein
MVDSRTPRTGNSELRACAREETFPIVHIGGDSQEKLKDSESGVRTVRIAELAEPLSIAGAPCCGPPLPFLTADGTLSIPFDSPERYQWWKPDVERLTVAETLQEARAGLATKERMKHAVTI